MISQERFNEIELEYGCGYWHECWEHACPCAITTENKGLRQDIWDGFKKEQIEIVEEVFIDDDYPLLDEDLIEEDEEGEFDGCEGDCNDCPGCLGPID